MCDDNPDECPYGSCRAVARLTTTVAKPSRFHQFLLVLLIVIVVGLTAFGSLSYQRLQQVDARKTCAALNDSHEKLHDILHVIITAESDPNIQSAELAALNNDLPPNKEC